MKKYLVIIALFPTLAFASKARLAALQEANHLVDIQTALINPSHIGLLKPMASFEFGASGNGAEAGLLKNISNGDKMLVYLGHQNTSALPGANITLAGSDYRAGSGFEAQNNPVEILWGNTEKAFGVSFSMVDKAESGTKETTIIGKIGSTQADFSYYGSVQLVSTAQKADKSDINAAPRIEVGGSKESDYRYFGSVVIGKASSEDGTTKATTDGSDTGIIVGVEDRSLKTATTDIYYGAKLIVANRDIEGKKASEQKVPAFFGIEHPITSWATFRGSVTQNLVIGMTKDDVTSTGKSEGIDNNTTVAAGLGLSFNNLTLDGTLTSATTGQINGTSFLANAAVTYTF